MAIKAYKERTLRFALNSETENDFDPRAEGKMNSLNVEVANVKIQKQIHHPSQMNPFCVINFEHTQSSALTQPMHGDNVFFGFSTLFPVKMTNELDRHLRTGKLVVTVADDSDSEIIYGYGKDYLTSKGQEGQPLTSKECRFCHIETLRAEWEAAIKQKGYFIIEMENCK